MTTIAVGKFIVTLQCVDAVLRVGVEISQSFEQWERNEVPAPIFDVEQKKPGCFEIRERK